MPEPKHLNLSPKEYRVMYALFEYRGASIDQLLKILGYGQSGKTNMYKPVRKLEKLDYVDAYVTAANRSEKIYFLSPRGYSKMLYHLSIPYKHQGKGFNKDFGDFAYETYKPPADLKTHHLFLVDFLIEANKFKEEVSEENSNENVVDFRDNRYASVEYQKKVTQEGAQPYDSTFIFRPDAELKVMSNTCFVEVDLGTERGKNLAKKFKGYKEYFEYLILQNKPLPSSVIFISEEMHSEAQKNRRWQSISNKFVEAVGEYATSVNLIYEPIDKIQEVFRRIYKPVEFQKKALGNIKNYDKPNGTALTFVDESRKFKWGKVYFSIANSTIYPFVRVEGNETKGWMLLWRFKEYIEKENIRFNGVEKVKEVIPVLLYKNQPPKPIHFFEKMDSKGFFEKRLHFKSRGEVGTWQDNNLKELPTNPLSDQ